MFQSGIVKFDKKTEKFPGVPRYPRASSTKIPSSRWSARSRWTVDRKVWLNDAGIPGLHRLDMTTGKFETWKPYQNMKGPHSVYGIYADSKNNIFFMDFGGENVGKIEAATGKLTLFPTPTPRSRPRRGRMDDRTASGSREWRAERSDVSTPRRKSSGNGTCPRPIYRALRRRSRQDRQGVDRGHEHRPRAAHGTSRTGESPKYPLAEPDQHPARVRGQLGHAAHVLGRQQPPRRDRESRAAGVGRARRIRNVALLSPLRRLTPGALVVGVMLFATAQAQTFPSKPLRTGRPVLAPADLPTWSRAIMADGATEALGQPMLIGERPGRGGNIGNRARRQSRARRLYARRVHDRHLCDQPEHLRADRLRSAEGFRAGVPGRRSDEHFHRAPSMSVKSIAELVAYIKANPASCRWAIGAVGSSNHLTPVWFSPPWRGSTCSTCRSRAPEMRSPRCWGGQVMMFVDNEPSILPQIKAGKAAAARRDRTGGARPTFPEVATMEELGYKGFVVEPCGTVYGRRRARHSRRSRS